MNLVQLESEVGSPRGGDYSQTSLNTAVPRRWISERTVEERETCVTKAYELFREDMGTRQTFSQLKQTLVNLDRVHATTCVDLNGNRRKPIDFEIGGDVDEFHN